MNELFSALAFVLTFVAFFPYYRSIFKEQIKPHVFSWFIWTGVTFTVCLAQFAGGAGVGAWPLGISALLTLGVAVLSWMKKTDTSIVPVDYLFLGLASLALPLWWMTDNPVWAVVILTTVDLLGFGPTVRKAWIAPFAEDPLFFSIGAIRNAMILLALEQFNWTTALFPAAVGLACTAFVLMILGRRRVIPKLTQL